MKRKVTALITRPGPTGPEVIVFDHPISGYQLPAGTVEDGETFAAAVLREGWEETGALGLELVRELAAFQDYRNEERHVFHLRATVAMPDDWRVATPDGGGLVWWCCWMPLDDAHSLVHEHQRDWLDAARPALDHSAAGDPPTRPRPPYPAGLRVDGEWEEFWAYPEINRRFVLAHDDAADPERCVRARGLCVTSDGEIVLVGGDELPWGIPGGGREGDESIRDNLTREVWEEACSRVVDARFLTALRGVPLDAQGGVGGPVEHHALFWARVELEPFVPEFETRARRVVSAREALDIVQFPGTTRLLLDRASAFDPALDWDPSRE